MDNQAVETVVGMVVALVGTVASAVVDKQVVVVETVVVGMETESAVGTQAADIVVDTQAADTAVGMEVAVEGTQAAVGQVEVGYRTVLPTNLDYSWSSCSLIASVGPGVISPSLNPTDSKNMPAAKPTWSRNSTASSCAA